MTDRKFAGSLSLSILYAIFNTKKFHENDGPIQQTLFDPLYKGEEFTGFLALYKACSLSDTSSNDMTSFKNEVLLSGGNIEPLYPKLFIEFITGVITANFKKKPNTKNNIPKNVYPGHPKLKVVRKGPNLMNSGNDIPMTPEIPARVLKKRKRSSTDDGTINKNNRINHATKRSKCGLIDDEAFEDTTSGFNNNDDDEDDEDDDDDDDDGAKGTG